MHASVGLAGTAATRGRTKPGPIPLGVKTDGPRVGASTQVGDFTGAKSSGTHAINGVTPGRLRAPDDFGKLVERRSTIWEWRAQQLAGERQYLGGQGSVTCEKAASFPTWAAEPAEAPPFLGPLVPAVPASALAGQFGCSTSQVPWFQSWVFLLRAPSSGSLKRNRRPAPPGQRTVTSCVAEAARIKRG